MGIKFDHRSPAFAVDISDVQHGFWRLPFLDKNKKFCYLVGLELLSRTSKLAEVADLPTNTGR